MNGAQASLEIAGGGGREVGGEMKEEELLQRYSHVNV